MRSTLLCFTIVSLLSTARATKNVANAFSSFDLYPEVIPFVPKALLNVRYPTADVCLGDVISQTRTIVPPKIAFDFKPDVNYTIIMLDPDIPSAQAPVLRNYLLWMQVNVYVKDTGSQVGYTVAGYIPPTPYPGSGYHRYTVLCYEQTRPIDVTALARLRLAVRRYRFDVVSFARRNGLQALVGGNFFRVRVPAIYDEYYCKTSLNSLTPVCA